MSEATSPGMPAVVGKYHVLERIGKGAMGVVFSARDEMMDRTVAVKLMTTDLEADPQARARFYREARVAGQLLHRNIVTVFDLGEDDGRPFIVMELLTGVVLTEFLKRPEARFLETKVGLLIHMCEGLAAAHAKEITHRDIKPGNLFVQSDGVLKILDFGLARVPTSTLTVTGCVMGTPDYMSPEQIQDSNIDARSDIFSAAAVGYFVLTGRKPFAALDLAGILQKVEHEDPPPIDERDAPPALARIIFHALAKDPGRRYQNISEMLAELERFRRQYDAETRRQLQATIKTAGDIAPLVQGRAEALARLGLPVPVGDDGGLLSAFPSRFQALVDPDATTVVLAQPLKRAEVEEIVRQVDGRLAILRAELGRLTAACAALEDAERAAKEDPGRALARLQAGGAALAAFPAVRQVIAACERAVAEREARAAELRTRLAASRAAAEAGDWVSAVRACDEVLAIDADNAEAAQRKQEARAALEREAAERARMLHQRLEAAREAVARGALGDAAARLAEARALDPDAAGITVVAEELDQARARAELVSGLRRKAAGVQASAREAFAAGRREEALAALQAFVESAPGLPGGDGIAPEIEQAARERARLAAEAARLEEVERRRAEVAKHLGVARTALAAEDSHGALTAALAALALEPDHVEARRIQDRAELQAFEKADAEACAEKARSEVARGLSLLASGQQREAIQAAEQALTFDPSIEQARTLLFDALRLEADARAASRRADFQHERSRAGLPAAHAVEKPVGRREATAATIVEPIAAGLVGPDAETIVSVPAPGFPAPPTPAAAGPRELRAVSTAAPVVAGASAPGTAGPPLSVAAASAASAPPPPPVIVSPPAAQAAAPPPAPSMAPPAAASPAAVQGVATAAGAPGGAAARAAAVAGAGVAEVRRPGAGAPAGSAAKKPAARVPPRVIVAAAACVLVVALVAVVAASLARTGRWPFAARPTPTPTPLHLTVLGSRDLSAIVLLPSVTPPPRIVIGGPVTPVVPTKPDAGLLDRLPGETDDALRARSARAAEHYQQARQALAGRNYAAAAALLSALVKEQANYKDAAALLAEARDGVRTLAQQAFDAGKQLEAAGDRAGAARAYERAYETDPSRRDAEEAAVRIRAAMRAEGEQLFKRAQSMDAVNVRTRAIELYEQALKLLPPDDPLSKVATERLRVLKGGHP